MPVIVKLILKQIVEGGDELDRSNYARKQSPEKKYSPFSRGQDCLAAGKDSLQPSRNFTDKILAGSQEFGRQICGGNQHLRFFLKEERAGIDFAVAVWRMYTGAGQSNMN